MEAVLHISQQIDRGNGFNLVDLVQFFAENESADSYALIIDSPGGDVAEGFRIADFIEDYEKPVKTIARRVYSIANVIFAAGQTREAEEGAEFMLHKAWAQIPANADEMREAATQLDIIDDRIASYIAMRTGTAKKTVLALMQTDTFINAEQAQGIGLIGNSRPAKIKAAAKFLPKAESRSDYPQAASNNARRALKWLEENDNPNNCLTAVGFARANQLAGREPLSMETIQRMANFRRHQQNKDVPYDEGCGGIAWDAWGGETGIAWAERIVKQESNIEMTLKNAVKELLSAAGLAPAVEVEAKNVTLTLENGDEVFVESEDGDLVGKETPAPAGRHELADGRVLVVAPGEGDMNVVEAVEEPAEAMEEEEAPEAMEEETQDGDKEEMAKQLAELQQKLAMQEEELQKYRQEAEARAEEINEAKEALVKAMELVKTESQPPAKNDTFSAPDQNPKAYSKKVERKYSSAAQMLMRSVGNDRKNTHEWQATQSTKKNEYRLYWERSKTQKQKP